MGDLDRVLKGQVTGCEKESLGKFLVVWAVTGASANVISLGNYFIASGGERYGCMGVAMGVWTRESLAAHVTCVT